MNFRFLLLGLSLALVKRVLAQNLESRVEDLEAEVVQINNNIEDVETSVSHNTGQLFEVINDVDDIDDLTDAQEFRIGAVEEENSLLRAELDDLKLLITTLSGEVQVLNDTTNQRVDVLQNDVISLESDVTTLENGLTALDSDVTVLANDITVIGTDVSDLGNDVNTLDTNLQALDASTDQRLDELERNSADYSHTAFLATHSAYEFVPSDPILWDTAILNPGGHYSTTLGVYTVPIDGIYQFVMHYRNHNDNMSGAWLEVDNVKVAYTYNIDADAGNHGADLVVTLSLTSGQQIWISPGNISAMYGRNEEGYIQSWFSGHLIYPL